MSVQLALTRWEKEGWRTGKGLLQHYCYFYIFSSLLHSADVAHMFCAHLIGIRKFKSMCSGRQGEAEAEQTLLKDFSNDSDSGCSLMSCMVLRTQRIRITVCARRGNGSWFTWCWLLIADLIKCIFYSIQSLEISFHIVCRGMVLQLKCLNELTSCTCSGPLKFC